MSVIETNIIEQSCAPAGQAPEKASPAPSPRAEMSPQLTRHLVAGGVALGAWLAILGAWMVRGF